MALDRILDRPRLGLTRRKPSIIIPLADRARDARQWELAAQLYRKALDRNPRNPPIWVQYGHALKESGELRDPDMLAQAEIAYRRALSLDPGEADTYLQLGHVLKLRGKTEEAREAYLRAVALDSSLESAASELMQFGWSEAHFSELRFMLGTEMVEMDDARPDAGPLPEKSSTPRDDGKLVVPDHSHNAAFFLDSAVMLSSLSSPDAQPVLDGSYDGYVGGSIIGWAIDKSAPATVARVELVIDGDAVSIMPANQFRQDLADRRIGSGYHGFDITVPPRFWDGQPHEVILLIVGHGHVLRNSPASVVFGRRDHTKPHVFSSSAAILAGQTPAISVIMPTYNRGELMERSIEKYIGCAAHVGGELIVIDDGSRDDTHDRLQRLARLHRNLVTDRITNSGPARARNLACLMARGTILLFVGDDVMPADDDLLRIHLAAHRRFPDLSQAILGKITWPNAIDFPVNFVMAFVQGDGQQQFGYKYMQAYAKYAWPFFYTSNVSVKRRLVLNWEKDGFDTSFTMAAFEDAEFALRVTKRFQAIGEDFGILYVPAANVVHFHPFTVESFVRRQLSVGMMAARFLELHPEREVDLGLSELIARLKTNPDEATFPIDHYLAIFEGLRSWLSVIENHYGLGTQNWHGDALGAIFHQAYLEGYTRSQTRPDLNYASACRYMLETVRTDLNRAVFSEVIGSLPGFGFV
jgi:glycosyltransferase involved in cell wall biosynthesis